MSFGGKYYSADDEALRTLGVHVLVDNVALIPVIPNERVVKSFNNVRTGPYAIFYIILGIVCMIIGITTISHSQTTESVISFLINLIFGLLITIIGVRFYMSETRSYEAILTTHRFVYRSTTMFMGKQISFFTREFYLSDIVRTKFSNRITAWFPFAAVFFFCGAVGAIIMTAWAFFFNYIVFAIIFGLLFIRDLKRRTERISVTFRNPQRTVCFQLTKSDALALFAEVHSLRADIPMAAEDVVKGLVNENEHAMQSSSLSNALNPVMSGEKIVHDTTANICGPWASVYMAIGGWFLISAIIVIAHGQSSVHVGIFVSCALYTVFCLAVGIYLWLNEVRTHQVILTTHRFVFRSNTRIKDKDVSFYEEDYYLKDITQLRFSNRFHIWFPILGATGLIHAAFHVLFIIIGGATFRAADFFFSLYVFILASIKSYRDMKFRLERIEVTTGIPKLRRYVRIPFTEARQLFKLFHALQPSVKCEVDESTLGTLEDNSDRPLDRVSGKTVVEAIMPGEKIIRSFTTVCRGRWAWIYFLLAFQNLLIALIIFIYGLANDMSAILMVVCLMFLCEGSVFLFFGWVSYFNQRRYIKLFLTTHRLIYSCDSRVGQKEISYLEENFYIRDITQLMFSNRIHAIFQIILLSSCVAFVCCIIGTIASIGDSNKAIGFLVSAFQFLLMIIFFGIKVFRDRYHRLERIHVISGFPKKTRHVYLTLDDAVKFFKLFHVVRGVKMTPSNRDVSDAAGSYEPPQQSVDE